LFILVSEKRGSCSLVCIVEIVVETVVKDLCAVEKARGEIVLAERVVSCLIVERVVSYPRRELSVGLCCEGVTRERS